MIDLEIVVGDDVWQSGVLIFEILPAAVLFLRIHEAEITCLYHCHVLAGELQNLEEADVLHDAR